MWLSLWMVARAWEPVTPEPTLVLGMSAQSPPMYGIGDVNGDGYGDTALVFLDRLHVRYGARAALDRVAEVLLDVGWADARLPANGRGDANGDGHDDLVAVTAFGGGQLRVWYGGAAGVGGPAVVIAAPGGVAVTWAGDLNGDGYDDLWVERVVGGVNEISLLPGQAAGLSTPIASWGSGAHAVVGGDDLDGDGTADVAWLGPSVASPGETVIWWAAGGTWPLAFTEVGTAPGAPPIEQDATLHGVGDLDGDGADDLLVSAQSGSGHLYLGSLAGPVPSAAALSSGTGRGAVVGGLDVNLDGFADWVQGAESGNVWTVYLGGPGGMVTAEAYTPPAWAEVPVPDEVYSYEYGPAVPFHVGDVDGDGAYELGVVTRQAVEWVEPTYCECDMCWSSVVVTSGYDVLYFLPVGGDGDGDGHGGDTDCNDFDASVHPGAVDVPHDRIDQDCDGLELCWQDADRDGGAAPVPILAPVAAAACGYVGIPTDDCDDSSAAVRAGRVETVSNGVDEDCDGVERCYLDADGDGWFGLGSVVDGPLNCAGPGLVPIEPRERRPAGWGAPSEVATPGDLDGDGFADVVAVFPTVGRVVWMRGGPRGLSVGARWQAPAGTQLGGLTVGDVNGDGFPELLFGVLGGPGRAGAVQVVVGRRGGPLGPVRRLWDGPVGQVFGAELGLLDADGDGRLELAVWSGAGWLVDLDVPSAPQLEWTSTPGVTVHGVARDADLDGDDELVYEAGVSWGWFLGGSTPFRQRAEVYNDTLPWSAQYEFGPAALSGNFNGDGRGELLAGVRMYDTTQSGTCGWWYEVDLAVGYVSTTSPGPYGYQDPVHTGGPVTFLGPAQPWIGPLDGVALRVDAWVTVITGERRTWAPLIGRRLPDGMVPAGDVDGDGVADVVSWRAGVDGMDVWSLSQVIPDCDDADPGTNPSVIGPEPVGVDLNCDGI